ncbi:MAG: DegV family EDD domain-containing protein [Lachnospiraceae bacterium]|nr:DegV family EDD domain-containing protein [Lachnospiraceae bacterium]
MKKGWFNFIIDEKKSIEERLFIITLVVSAVSFSVIIISNLIAGTTVADIAVISALILLMGLTAFWAIRKKHIKAGGAIASTLVVFCLLPYTYFTSGAVFGGAPCWFIFAGLFVSLIMSGKSRVFFLVADLIVAGACYVVAYTKPELVRTTRTLTAYICSYTALAFICIAIGVILSIEILIYKKESERNEKQRKEIAALNDAQNRFFSSMSHEIRTPINTIIGLNEMILREDVSDEVAEDAANIRAASKMLLHLINDILDMSKLESGSMQLSCVPYRIGDMLSELVNMIWIRARDKRLEFNVNVSPDVPAQVIGDDVRVKQILINILNNAVKYTREGSVSLSIQCGKMKDDKLSIIYTISDTGMGIKKENLPYLFDAFKRVDEDKNRHIEGTGLGLSIVRQLVDLMGGEVTVNSIYTQGTTFVIEIPQVVSGSETVGDLNLEKKHKIMREAYYSRFEAPDASVLVVDDNASNLMVCKKLLRDTKVSIDTASSGEDALRLTTEKFYHVIFMDHMMPGMDGIECHRRILTQKGGKCSGSKIISFTANADAESRALYEREGFDGFLIKPVDGKSLEKELARNLPRELVHYSVDDDNDVLEESMAWINTEQNKRLIAITTESTADLPIELLEQYDIAEIPHLVSTGEGVFRDSIDLDTKGLIAYMSKNNDRIETHAPDVAASEAFFAEQLSRANSIIHITLSKDIENSGFASAQEAAASFNNVTVIESGHLSSGQGLQVLEACRLAQQGKTVSEITDAVKKGKELVQTSFIVDNLDYLSRAGQVSPRIARLTKTLSLRPTLVMKKGRMTVGRVFFGSRQKAWKKYIKHALAVKSHIDTHMLFITYTSLNREELEYIKEEVEKIIHFENVYFQKAAPSVSVNSGPNTFGLLYSFRSDE